MADKPHKKRIIIIIIIILSFVRDNVGIIATIVREQVANLMLTQLSPLFDDENAASNSIVENAASLNVLALSDALNDETPESPVSDEDLIEMWNNIATAYGLDTIKT